VLRALRRDPRVRVSLRDVAELDAAAARHGVKDPERVPHNIFKNCASSRLKLPFLLDELGIRRAIYLDWDTVVLCDLSLLWAEFERFAAAGAAVGFAQSDPTGVSGLDHYRDWDLPRHPTAGSVNSGVMLVDVPALMRVKADYWAAVEAIIWGRVDLSQVRPGDGDALYWAFTKAFPLGDQDVLNCLLARMPQLLRVLPPEYNFCLEWPFLEDMPTDHPDATAQQRAPAERRRMPCVLHYCGAKLLPTAAGEATLPCDNPWKASHMFVKHFQLESHRVLPPGRAQSPQQGS